MAFWKLSGFLVYFPAFWYIVHITKYLATLVGMHLGSCKLASLCRINRTAFSNVATHRIESDGLYFVGLEGLPEFSRHKIPKLENIPKWPYNLPSGRKIFEMAAK
jgi:hypothetical protein